MLSHFLRGLQPTPAMMSFGLTFCMSYSISSIWPHYTLFLFVPSSLSLYLILSHSFFVPVSYLNQAFISTYLVVATLDWTGYSAQVNEDEHYTSSVNSYLQFLKSFLSENTLWCVCVCVWVGVCVSCLRFKPEIRLHFWWTYSFSEYIGKQYRMCC